MTTEEYAAKFAKLKKMGEKLQQAETLLIQQMMDALDPAKSEAETVMAGINTVIGIKVIKPLRDQFYTLSAELAGVQSEWAKDGKPEAAEEPPKPRFDQN